MLLPLLALQLSNSWRGEARLTLRLLILSRLPHSRRTTKVVLERQVRRSNAELARGELSQVVVTRLDLEADRVERILESQTECSLPLHQLLTDREIRPVLSREAATLDVHWRAVEVSPLKCCRRCDVVRAVPARRPG